MLTIGMNLFTLFAVTIALWPECKVAMATVWKTESSPSNAVAWMGQHHRTATLLGGWTDWTIDFKCSFQRLRPSWECSASIPIPTRIDDLNSWSVISKHCPKIHTIRSPAESPSRKCLIQSSSSRNGCGCEWIVDRPFPLHLTVLSAFKKNRNIYLYVFCNVSLCSTVIFSTRFGVVFLP